MFTVYFLTDLCILKSRGTLRECTSVTAVKKFETQQLRVSCRISRLFVAPIASHEINYCRTCSAGRRDRNQSNNSSLPARIEIGMVPSLLRAKDGVGNELNGTRETHGDRFE